MNRMAKILLICLFLLSTITGCFSADLAKQRAKQAGKGASIMIGVPVPREFTEKNTGFLKGLTLALEDINAKGINGKKIQLEIADDQAVFKDAVDIAQKFSQNTRMTAVIGHWYSDICIPVAAIYEKAGMLEIVPTVSNPELTENNFRYVFQNIPSDKKVAGQMCQYALQQGYKKLVVYYEDSSYGRNLADAFEREAEAKDIKVIDRSSGLVSDVDFKKAHDKWQALDFDAVFLALNMPEGALFIKEIRKINPSIPILSGDGLDVNEFTSTLGKDSEDVVIASISNPHNENPEFKKFANRYKQRYGEEPDVWAVQGYDSLQLIAQAIEQTDSCSPAVLAAYLRDMESMKLISGDISFNEDGEIQGREIYMKKVVKGTFEYLD